MSFVFLFFSSFSLYISTLLYIFLFISSTFLFVVHYFLSPASYFLYFFLVGAFLITFSSSFLSFLGLFSVYLLSSFHLLLYSISRFYLYFFRAHASFFFTIFNHSQSKIRRYIDSLCMNDNTLKFYSHQYKQFHRMSLQ